MAKARGLPWHASDQDIAHFFAGLNIVPCVFSFILQFTLCVCDKNHKFVENCVFDFLLYTNAQNTYSMVVFVLNIFLMLVYNYPQNMFLSIFEIKKVEKTHFCIICGFCARKNSINFRGKIFGNGAADLVQNKKKEILKFFVSFFSLNQSRTLFERLFLSYQLN